MGTLQFTLIWLIYPWVKVWELYWTPAVAVAGTLLNALCGKTLKNLASTGTTVNVNGNDIQNIDKPLIVNNTPSGYNQV